jgi:hypothetical protein
LVRGILSTFSLCLCGTVPAGADQGWEGQSFWVTWENDATRGSDRHYTQGAMLRYLSSDAATPEWLKSFSHRIPDWGFESQGWKFGLEVGQQMYTPEDLDAVELVKDDQPYAGWFYWAMSLQRRGPTNTRHLPVMETLRVDLGMVGPISQAEHTQKVWHGRDPRGWHNQLGNEPGLALRYDRTYLLRVPLFDHFVLDGLPTTEWALGNVDIHLGIKATLRCGYNVPNEFEVPALKTRKKFGAYMFASLAGRAVAHSIFLDGNTWKESHRVEREPLVGYAVAGASLVLGPVEIIGSNNYVSHEFRGQRLSDSYGSVTILYKF